MLFEDASLQVNRGDRVGLVGANGAGKSTLFSLILGEASPDDGRVSLERSASVGYLPQETAPAGDETVLELAMAINPQYIHAMMTNRLVNAPVIWPKRAVFSSRAEPALAMFVTRPKIWTMLVKVMAKMEYHA